ncbi:MAG: class I SAM-dependent methyltransferase [Methylobacterium mesophilicum]|nr:class I SAM-dependent methyltransferase [Methylobacterium mesophilicum]
MAERGEQEETQEPQETKAGHVVRIVSKPAGEPGAAFHRWLRAELRPDMRLLDLSAGSSTRDPHSIARGEARELVGAAADRALLRSADFDHVVRIENDWLPLADRSFDLIWSDGGLEHAKRPAALLGEVHRLLKPGGQFFFQTPNLGHYRTLCGWIASNGLWSRLDRSLGGKGSTDPSTQRDFFRANTRSALAHLASAAGFTEVEFRMEEPESGPQERAAWASRLSAGYSRLVNRSNRLAGFRATLLGRLRR